MAVQAMTIAEALSHSMHHSHMIAMVAAEVMEAALCLEMAAVDLAVVGQLQQAKADIDDRCDLVAIVIYFERRHVNSDRFIRSSP